MTGFVRMVSGQAFTTLLDECGNGGVQVLRRARLRQHRVAPGATRTSRILREGSIPGDGEHGNRARPRIRFEPARQLLLDPGDMEIGHDDRGEQVECPLEGLQAIVGRPTKLLQPRRASGAPDDRLQPAITSGPSGERFTARLARVDPSIP